VVRSDSKIYEDWKRKLREKGEKRIWRERKERGKKMWWGLLCTFSYVVTYRSYLDLYIKDI